jgi:WD40 repeat protein
MDSIFCNSVLVYQDAQLLYSLTDPSDAVTLVAISPDSKLVITGSMGSSAKIWNAQNGQLVLTFKHSSPFPYQVQNVFQITAFKGKWHISSGSFNVTFDNPNFPSIPPIETDSNESIKIYKNSSYFLLWKCVGFYCALSFIRDRFYVAERCYILFRGR